MSTTMHEELGEEQTELKRVMGPKLLLLFIVGDILGTGVAARRPARGIRGVCRCLHL